MDFMAMSYLIKNVPMIFHPITQIIEITINTKRSKYLFRKSNILFKFI